MVSREFFRLMRLNDIRFKNWRKSKLRTVSMVDCLQMEKNIWKKIERRSQSTPLVKINQVNYCWQIGDLFPLYSQSQSWMSIIIFFVWEIGKLSFALHSNERKKRGKIEWLYRWLPLEIGCCIVDGDEMLRVTGTFAARTFSECARNGEQRVDFLSDIVVDDMRANSDWYGCRREGRRRISISSILHSSMGNGMS